MKRSMLFIPGNTPGLLINGACLGADMLIFDLEDAVSPDEKDSARVLVRNILKDLDFSGIGTIVRVNSVDSAYFEKDLEAIVPCSPDMIMLPKTGCEADVLRVDARIGALEEKLGMEKNSVRLMLLIETAIGVENAFKSASASERVCAIFLGAEDLSADLRCKRSKEGREIEYARARLVCAGRAAGVDVYDTPFTDVNDDEGIRRDAEAAKALGFTGKAAISPRHVDAINEVFSPSEKDIEYAYEVMEAIALARQQGRGAIALRGKMIDAPIVARAQQTIAAAEELGLGREI
ncbi:MAG TPA: CoA ester lyase [Bacillota bacterium]|nr:CoA ester lyase [Bacillota bacterium]HQC36197.1 CoA ester lyase [Bacillota bacterium]